MLVFTCENCQFFNEKKKKINKKSISDCVSNCFDVNAQRDKGVKPLPFDYFFGF
jgi:hypothetical protein